MATLRERRINNKRQDLLFKGMELQPVKLHPEFYKVNRNFFKNVIHPTSIATLKRYEKNTRLV